MLSSATKSHPEIMHNGAQEKVSKSDMNLQLLSQYDYKTEFRKVEDNGKFTLRIKSLINFVRYLTYLNSSWRKGSFRVSNYLYLHLRELRKRIHAHLEHPRPRTYAQRSEAVQL